MAENGKQRDAGGQGAEDRKATQRVVMRRARVIEVPDTVEGKSLEDVAKILTKQLKAGPLEGWLMCGVFEGSKIGAIEAYAGKPGTPDAKVGVFKAPTVTAMKGGAKYDQPALPKVERTAID